MFTGKRRTKTKKTNRGLFSPDWQCYRVAQKAGKGIPDKPIPFAPEPENLLTLADRFVKKCTTGYGNIQ